MTELLSYCGFNCRECPKYQSGDCEGCKGDAPRCAFEYKDCPVRQCCIEMKFNTCGECNKFSSVKECKKFNPAVK